MDIFDKLDKDESLFLRRPDVDQSLWNNLVINYFNPKGHLYFCTSGTSGGSLKVIEIKHKTLLEHSKALCSHFHINENARWLICLPTYYMGGISIIYRSYICQSKYFITENVDICEIFKEVEDKHITHISLVPYQVNNLLKNELKIPKSIKMIFIGGDYLSRSDFLKLSKMPNVFYPTYGASELCSQVATSKLSEYNTFNILPWNKCSIEEHRIKINSPFMAKGQYILTGNCVEYISFDQQSFHTQDTGVISKNSLKVEGRFDRNIKVAGKFINLDDIENSLEPVLKENFFVTSKEDQRVGNKPVLVSTKIVDKDLIRKFGITESLVIPKFKYTNSSKLIKNLNAYL